MEQTFAALSGSLLFSIALSSSAYQQVEAKWWKGPSTASALLGVGLLIMLVTVYQNRPSPNHLILTLSRTAVIFSFAALIGSLLALSLRPYLGRRTITAGVLIGGFTLTYALLSKIDFT